MGSYGHVFGVFQGSFDDLLIFLTTLSVVGWVAVGVTVIFRFVSFLRHRRYIRPRDKSDSQELVS